MPLEGVPDFALYVPGADAALNASRRIHVRGAVIHTTQGEDSRELGANRLHSTPGTFNFLIRNGVLYCFYPAWVRCSHSAGGNFIGPGFEIEMYDGQPVATEDLIMLGRLILWLNEEYGVPLNYKEGDPRIWADKTTFSGFIAHAGLDYPPDPSFRHTDNITAAEFIRALALAGGSYQEEDFMTFKGVDGPLKDRFFTYSPRGIERELSKFEAFVSITVLKVEHHDLKQTEYQVLGSAPTAPTADSIAAAVIKKARDEGIIPG